MNKIRQLVECRHELYLEMFKEAKEAISKAEAATEKRFTSVNEFRATLSDQTATFITRKESEAALKSSIEKSTAETNALRSEILPQIQKQGSRGDWYDGRGSATTTWLAIIGAVIATTAFVIDIVQRSK